MVRKEADDLISPQAPTQNDSAFSVCSVHLKDLPGNVQTNRYQKTSRLSPSINWKIYGK
jgi:hypothetical protein